MKKVITLSLLLIAAIGASQAIAGAKIVPNGSNDGSTRPPGPDCALLIGCSKYAHIPGLGSAPANDVEMMKNSLATLGFEVATSIDSTRAELKKTLDTFRLEAASKKRGQVVIYFSGSACEANGQLLMLPIDASARETKAADNIDILEDSISLGYLYRSLGEINAGQHFVIVDACRDHISVPNSVLVRETTPDRTTTWFSCASGGVSYTDPDSSLFTNAFAKALAIPQAPALERAAAVIKQTQTSSATIANSIQGWIQRPGFYTDDPLHLLPKATEFKPAASK